MSYTDGEEDLEPGFGQQREAGGASALPLPPPPAWLAKMRHWLPAESREHLHNRCRCVSAGGCAVHAESSAMPSHANSGA